MSIPSVVLTDENGNNRIVHVEGFRKDLRSVTVLWPQPEGDRKARSFSYDDIVSLNIEAATLLDFHDRNVWSAGYMPDVKMKAYREEREKKV